MDHQEKEASERWLPDFKVSNCVTTEGRSQEEKLRSYGEKILQTIFEELGDLGGIAKSQLEKFGDYEVYIGLRNTH